MQGPEAHPVVLGAHVRQHVRERGAARARAVLVGRLRRDGAAGAEEVLRVDDTNSSSPPLGAWYV